MRLTRGVPLQGLEPEFARTLARACHQAPADIETLAEMLGISHSETQGAVEALAQGGYLQPYASKDQHLWTTTVKGGGLSNASFLRPIARSKAEALLLGVVERAAGYNADPTKLMWIDRLVMFGSMVAPDVELVGDVDLNVEMSRRIQDDDQYLREARAYSRDSGRKFSTFLDQLLWPQHGVLRLLKNRSGYISIHQEDVTRFTETTFVVYQRDR